MNYVAVALTLDYRLMILMKIVGTHLSKTQLRTIKFHRLLHLIALIVKFGSLKAICAGLYDAIHPLVTRVLYKETNKHAGFLDKVARKVM